MTTDRPTTILATPAIPAHDGVGIQQRAARTLAAFEALGDVDLVVCRPPLLRLVDRIGTHVGRLPPRDEPTPARPHAFAGRLDPIAGEIFLRRAALAFPRAGAIATAAVAAMAALAPTDPTPHHPAHAPEHPNRFHAFRLAAATALPRSAATRLRTLDLDDLESVTADAIATLAHRARDTAIAAIYRTLAARLAPLERRLIPSFDHVYVGSPADAAWLAAHYPGIPSSVLPNVVAVPPLRDLPDLPRHPGPIRLLFVGALDYYPNIDALRRLIDDILPALLSLRPGSFELHVVGRGGPAWLLHRLRRARATVFHGPAPSMAPHLARADALLAPLGAGGGTRIKLLEAFAAGVPVIATTIAAAGLAVADHTHLRLADHDAAFIDACVALIDDPLAWRPLRARAHAFVAAHHHPTVFADAIALR